MRNDAAHFLVLILVSIDVNYEFFFVLPGCYLEFDYYYFVLQRRNKRKKEKSVVLKGDVTSARYPGASIFL